MLFSSKDTTAANKNYESIMSWLLFKSLMAKHRHNIVYISRTKFCFFWWLQFYLVISVTTQVMNQRMMNLQNFATEDPKMCGHKNTCIATALDMH